MKYKIVSIIIVIFLLTGFASATEIPAGPVSGDWYATGNPHNINGEITILTGTTLNIHEGVEVIFQGHFKLIINGYLEAIGTQTDSILFTAADTSIGWHSLRFVNAPDSSHLSYCIIQYGKATGDSADAWGGGILCYTSSPVITHSSIRWNWAEEFDGGICIGYNSNPTITFSNITDNSASAEGGIGIYSDCSPLISHCMVTDNISSSWAGGIYMSHGGDPYSHPVISSCIIMNNTAAIDPFFGGGVGIASYQGDINAEILNCYIIGNTAGGNGGGIRVFGGSGLIQDCIISGNHAGRNGGGVSLGQYGPEIVNCRIKDNYAGLNGGGINLTFATARIRHCVIESNHADGGDGGGIEIYGGGWSLVEQSTIYNNYANIAGSQIDVWMAGIYPANCIVGQSYGDHASVNFFDISTSFDTSYCDFYQTSGEYFSRQIPDKLGILTGINVNGDSCDATSNIFENPMFVDPVGGDYRLQWGSPCIDAGDPALWCADPDSTVADIGAFYFDQNLPLRALLSPSDIPILIPAEGGSFDFTVRLTNITPSNLNTNVMTWITLPDSNIVSPIIGPLNVNLPGEMTVSRKRIQTVPAGAPSGIYTYHIQVMTGADTSSDSFTFAKLGSQGLDWQNGWINTGEPFESIAAEPETGTPGIIALHQNYPNPTIVLSFQLLKANYTTLTVFDVQGCEVARLVDGWRDAGSHEVTFDGSSLTSGIYIYQLKAGDFNANGKMMLTK